MYITGKEIHNIENKKYKGKTEGRSMIGKKCNIMKRIIDKRKIEIVWKKRNKGVWQESNTEVKKRKLKRKNTIICRFLEERWEGGMKERKEEKLIKLWKSTKHI